MSVPAKITWVNIMLAISGNPQGVPKKHPMGKIGMTREILKPGFYMIVGDRSRSLGSLVNCSAIVTIIWKPNFYFASDRQWSQQLPTIATITIAGIESEPISAIVAIVDNCQRSQKVYGNHQCSDCSDRNNPSDHMEIIAQRSQWSWRLYGNQTLAIVTIVAIDCFQRSQRSQWS